ncbi:sucrose nonfermenting 4-like protein [Tanacetum coccineum]
MSLVCSEMFVAIHNALHVLTLIVHASPDENLKDITLKILQNRVATLPITHSTSNDVVCRYFRHSASSLPILQLPICSLPLGTWVPKIRESNRQPLTILTPNSSLSTALNLFVQAEVSSIPIVDDNDSLLDVYSRSDITALAKDKIYTHINLEEMTIHQASTTVSISLPFLY